MEILPLISITYRPLSGLTKASGTSKNYFRCSLGESAGAAAHVIVSGYFNGKDPEGDFVSRLLQYVNKVFIGTGKAALVLDLREFVFPFGREMTLMLRYVNSFREGDSAIVTHGDCYRSLNALWHTEIAAVPFCVPIFRTIDAANNLISLSRPKLPVPTDLLSTETKIAVGDATIFTLSEPKLLVSTDLLSVETKIAV